MAILEQAAEELARHVRTVARLAGLSPDWSYAGGTFSSRVLREAVASRIGSPPRPPLLPPIGGALLAAAQHLDWQTDRPGSSVLPPRFEAAPAKDCNL